MDAVRLSFRALHALREQMGKASNSVSRLDSKTLLVGDTQLPITDLLYKIKNHPGATEMLLDNWSRTLAWVLREQEVKAPEFTNIAPFIWPLLANLAEESIKAGAVARAILPGLDAVAVVRVSGRLLIIERMHLLQWNLSADTIHKFAIANVATTGCTFKIESSASTSEARMIRVLSEDGVNSSRIACAPVLSQMADLLWSPFLVWIPTWFSLIACRHEEAQLIGTCQAIANSEFAQVTHAKLTTTPILVSSDGLSWVQ